MATVLLPLDGSEHSEHALPYVRLMGKLLGAEVHLLHVVTPDEHERFAARREQLRRVYTPLNVPAAGLEPALLTHDEAYLRQILQRMQAAGVAARCEVVAGAPAEAIVEAAERCDADLIVMATHGRGGLGRRLLGSVAHTLLRSTRRPLLVVRAPARRPAIGRILVPLDGSQRAREALPVAIDLARRAGADLVLLTVLAPHFGLDPVVMPPLQARDLAAVREGRQAELAALAAEIPGLAVTPVVVEGLAAATICREAAARDVDLIVMASHGHGGRHLFGLGSAADGVIHGAHAPVLVVPTDLDAPVAAQNEAAGGATA